MPYRLDNVSESKDKMNFTEFNNLLIDARAGSHAAECHGFLSGYLCVTDSISSDTVRHFLLADMDNNEADRCEQKISELANEISSGLSSEEFGFELLLPEEDSDLVQRSEALIQWCEGFLSGLGTAGITDPDILSLECRELINDLNKICQLDLDDLKNSGNDDESAFFELTEYVRIGATTLHDELRNKRQNINNITIH